MQSPTSAPPLPASSPTPTSIFQGTALPLFVGITGHRDLRDEDVAPLREVVQAELRKLKAAYPHTPLVVLSPLGEGADRLVACAAMKEGFELIVPLPLPRDIYERSFETDEAREEFHCLIEGAQAVFTLPWLSSSEKDRNGSAPDAPTPEQIEGQYAAMGAYIARYSHVLLALWDGDDAPERERIGGTSHIVRMRLQGAVPPYGPAVSLLEHAGYGAVHHIVTPRKSHPWEPKDKEMGEPFSLRVLPEDAAEDFARIDIFNADVQKSGQSLSGDVKQNIGYLIESSDHTVTLDVPENLRFPVAIYGWADTLSTVFARQMNRTTRNVFLLVFFAALSFNLFHSLPHHSAHEPAHGEAATTHQTSAASSHTEAAGEHGAPVAETHGAPVAETHGAPVAETHGAPVAETHSAPVAPATEGRSTESTHGEVSPAVVPAEAGEGEHSSSELATPDSGFSLANLWGLLPWFLWVYLVLVGVNVTVHGRAEKQELQTKYQDYRALAEGLRVQIYWRVSGLHEDVSDHYLGKQRGELNWIRHAIKSCNVLADAYPTPQAHAPATILPIVVQLWAREQRNYYVRKAHREHEEMEKQEKLIRRFVMSSVILTVVLGLVLSLPSMLPVEFLEPLKHWVEDPWNHALVMITIVMLAVTAGLLHGYNTLMARSEHTKRYGRMGTLFQRACTELESQLKAGHSHKTSLLLHELGREALAENADWVLLHRERPLEVPHAG